MSRKDKRKEERRNKKLKRTNTEHHTTSNLSKSSHDPSKSSSKPKKAVKFSDSQVFDFNADMAPDHRTGPAKSAKLNKPVLDDSDSEGDFGFDEDDFGGFGSEDDDMDVDSQSVDDTWAALKALKDKKTGKSNGTKVTDKGKKNEPQTAEDVMAALKAAKAKKNKKEPETADDVMAALKAAKAKKTKKEPETAEDVMAALKAAKAKKTKKEPETADDVMAALKAAKAKKTKKEPETAEDVMAALKAAKTKKGKKEPETADDVMAALKAAKAKKNKKEPETAEDVMAALKAAKAKKSKKEPETAEDVMAALKAAKASKSKQATPKSTASEKKPVKSSLADLIKSRESQGKLERSEPASKKKSDAVYTKEEQRLMQRDEEDIDYYTRMLGMKDKNGKMPKSEEEEDDGLDGLLDGLDLDFGDGYDDLGDNSDDEVPNLVGEDGEEVSDLSGEDENDKVEGLPWSDDDLDSDDFDSDVDLEGLEGERSEDGEGSDNDDDMGELSSEDSEIDDDEDDDEEEDDDDEEEAIPKRENPYVAPVPAGKYVPPSARKRLEASGDAESEELIKLRRLVKGSLNKLTEANIASIVQELDRLYLLHPRQHLTSIISSIVIDSVALQGSLLDTFLMVHAALITALYKTTGLEFGAHFLQTLIETFDKHYKQVSESSTKTYGKEANNLLALLAELYSFQFVSCGLIYDMIRMFLEGDIDEAKTELLLKLIRSSGSQLRSDDPAALKEIIFQLQVSVSKADPNSINARTKFLVETIAELKNNRHKRAAAVSETTSAAKTRMKKFLGTIQGRTSEPLSVSLNDIRSVETRGKWWLVGAAWRNNADGTGAKKNSGLNDEDEIDLAAMEDILESAEPDWMDLAHKQRMNTDVRRAVFIALMSSEDYVDACDRLQRLKLKSKQEREIPRVLLHCCNNEEVYNAFYQVVATRLCAQRSIKKTFQFALWDFLADLEGGSRINDEDEDSDLDQAEKMEKLKRRGNSFDTEELNDENKLRKTVHMARLYAALTAEGILMLDILKTANFVSPSAETQIFLEMYFVTLYTQLAKKQNSSSSSGSSNKSKKMSFGDAMFQKQKIDEKGLVQLLVKTSENAENSALLLKKIKYFQKNLLKSSAITSKSQREKVEWGVNVTCDVIDELNNKSSSM